MLNLTTVRSFIIISNFNQLHQLNTFLNLVEAKNKSYAFAERSIAISSVEIISNKPISIFRSTFYI